jgi:DMSO/TMAO reductase YedYZ heme-binding membrane subunit
MTLIPDVEQNSYSHRERMTLGVEAIFWFISHTMSYQTKRLELHIYS